MDLRFVRSFLILAEELNFTRAAARLNMTQPALTNQINAIEKLLGAKIIDRSKRKIALTPAGEAFQPVATGLVNDFERGLEHVRQVASGSLGVLRIGYCSASMGKILGDVLHAYRAAAPKVTINIEQMNSNASIEAVRAQKIDAAFFHPPVDTEGLETIELAEDPVLLVLEKGASPKGRKPKPGSWPVISLKDVSHIPLVFYPRRMGPHLHDRIMAAYAAEGVVPTIQQNVGFFTSGIDIVAAGGGVTFLPAALHYACPEHVELRQVKGDPITIPYGIATNPESKNPSTARLLEIVQELCP